jgi:hypothetical protein
MTIASGSRWHLWANRNIQTWFELWLEMDYHNYIASVTVLTFEIGLEWVWRNSRPAIKKTKKQIVWYRI